MKIEPRTRPRRNDGRLAAVIVTFVLSLAAAAQDRSFSQKPDILLGLRKDRSASITFADLDGDGDLDVVIANGRHWTQANQVFINNGKPAGKGSPPQPGLSGRFTLAYNLGEELTTSYAVLRRVPRLFCGHGYGHGKSGCILQC